MTGEFLRFLVTSGIAAVVNLASRYALNRLMPFEVAVVIAYLIGMTTAYVLARLFVFEVSGRSVASEFRRFAVVNLVALAIVWLVSVGLARTAVSRDRLHLACRRRCPCDRRAVTGDHELFWPPPLHFRPAPDMKTDLIAPLAALLAYVPLHWSGIALDPDSWAAWQGAVSIVAGKGYTYFSGNPIHSWPPLYSLYLAGWIAAIGPTALTLMIANAVLVVLQAVLWQGLWRTLTRDLGIGRRNAAVGPARVVHRPVPGGP